MNDFDRLNHRLAIIPAAGNAARFGGLYKELLPVSNGENALQAAYRRVCVQCEQVLIITTPEKIALHARACPRATFVLQHWPDEGLWGAVRTGLLYEADEYYLTMPDTIYEGTWPKEPYNSLGIGVFKTQEPERFGILHDNHIVDKGMWTKPGTSFMAWGALCWTKELRDYWLNNRKLYEGQDFTGQLNIAIYEFGYSCFQISDYHDFANLEYYNRYLASTSSTTACSNLTPNHTA